MNLTYSKQNKTLLVKIDGEIDHHTCEKLRTETEHALEKMRMKHIVFIFTNVTFMDSSGIGVLIGRYKDVSHMGGRVAVAAPSEQMERIFALSGLKSIIPCFATQEQALIYVEGARE